MSTTDELYEKYRARKNPPSAQQFFDEDDLGFLELLQSSASSDGDPDFAADVYELVSHILYDNPEGFVDALCKDETLTYRRHANPAFAHMVVLGLLYGVACDNGNCANYLGALFYMGDLVEQDYARAKELYELAESKGSERAMLNLGYIYEYGRCAEPDYLQAFMQYAKVMALTDNFEAYYKMGDMYSRAQAVPLDLRVAFTLYDKSFDAAQNDAERAQPAIRLAALISNKKNEEWDISYNPMGALALYQLAERGLRIDIANGQLYYRKRLQEAIDGQNRMRELLDKDGFC